MFRTALAFSGGAPPRPLRSKFSRSEVGAQVREGEHKICVFLSHHLLLLAAEAFPCKSRRPHSDGTDLLSDALISTAALATLFVDLRK